MRPSANPLAVAALIVGLLFIGLPIALYAALHPANQPPPEPRPAREQTFIVLGLIDYGRVEQTAGGTAYFLTYLYPTQSLGGETVWLARERQVRESTYDALPGDTRAFVVYSRTNPYEAYLLGENPPPAGASAASPTTVPLLTTLVLVGLASGGAGMAGWGWRELRGPDSLAPSRRLRRAMLAGCVLTIAFGQAMVLSNLFAQARNSASSTNAFFLGLLSVPGYWLASTLSPSLIPYVNLGEAGLAFSAIFWFAVGAVTAAFIRRNWLVVAVWIGLALVTVGVGFGLTITALVNSSP